MNFSALMLTTPDRWFFRDLAIETFLVSERDPDDELVVFCEDAEEFATSAPRGVRFVTAPLTSHVAEKRNHGVEACQHDWITMWDDDDWHGLDRLYQARRAIAQRPEIQLLGHRSIFYVELTSDRRGTYRYEYGRGRAEADLAPYLLDGTMTFHRDIWRYHPFQPTVTRGDGGWWIVHQLGARGVLHTVLPQGSYVATLHGLNTSARPPRVAHGDVISDSFMTIVDPVEVERVFPRPIWRRYEAAAWAQQDPHPELA